MPPHWLRYIPLYLPWLALLGWLAPIASIRTGQFVGDAKLWEGEIRLNPE